MDGGPRGCLPGVAEQEEDSQEGTYSPAEKEEKGEKMKFVNIVDT
jgi:hypothetical protein